MFGWFKLDWHSLAHLCGCYLLTDAAMHFGASYLLATLIVFTAGFAHEICDEVFHGRWIFDPRGGDGKDIVVNCVGIGLALLFERMELWLH